MLRMAAVCHQTMISGVPKINYCNKTGLTQFNSELYHMVSAIMFSYL